MRRLQGGHEPEHEPGHDRQRGGERKRRRIEPNGLERDRADAAESLHAERRRRVERAEQPDTPPRDDDAREPAERREYQAFRQQLPDEPLPPCTDVQTNRDLATSS